MCVSFLSAHSPSGHGLWRCRGGGKGGPGAGVFLFTAPHTAYPHAFVSGPSFWVAAATGTSWNIPLVLSLTTGDLFVFPPFLTSRIGDLFVPSLGGQVPARHSTGLRSHDGIPQCLSSKWVKLKVLVSVHSPTLHPAVKKCFWDSGVESNQAPCLKLDPEVFKDFMFFVLVYLDA